MDAKPMPNSLWPEYTAREDNTKKTMGGPVGYADGGAPDERPRSPVPEWLPKSWDVIREGRPDDKSVAPSAINFLGDIGGFGAEMTGIPSVFRGVRDVMDESGDNLTKAKGSAEIIAGAIPGLGMTRRGGHLVHELYKTIPRIGATGAVLGAPDFIEAARADTPSDARSNEIKSLNDKIDAATREITKIGQTKFRGKPEEANASREQAAKPYNGIIEKAQLRIAQINAAADAEAKERETRGAPVRESLPPILSKTMPIWTGVLGAMATRGIFNKWNAEYNSALNAYRAAAKTGDVPQMALRQTQLQKLETHTPWKNPVTYLAAGLPAELRLGEHAIDMRNDPESRAHKEADARMHDPWAVGQDVGTSLLSAGTALGMGAKFSKDQPERALGKAIASREAYQAAPELADDYATALRAGEGLRKQHPSLLAAQPDEPGFLRWLRGSRRETGVSAPEYPSLPGTVVQGGPSSAGQPRLPAPEPIPPTEKLSERLPKYREAAGPPPGPEAPSSLPSASSAPTFPGTDIPLPPGAALNSRGLPYNEHTGHPLKKQIYTPKEAKSAKSKPAGKVNKTATEDEIAPGVPSKPPRPFDPDDPINRGMKDGGIVQRGLALARRYADGGAIGGGTGLLQSDVPGRTDHLPLSVEADSYIFPADIVSALGEGNTLAGAKVLDSWFGEGGPQNPAAFANGGVPILAAGGEYYASPSAIARKGGGDVRQGHRVADALVKQIRSGAIKKLRSLPGPSKG
jgi:hypothetical protein